MKTSTKALLAGLLCVVLLPTASLAHFVDLDDDEDLDPPQYQDYEDYEDFEDWFEDCLEDDEECEDDYDFDQERQEIITDIHEEIEEYVPAENQAELMGLLKKLENTTDEDAFFDILDQIDDVLDRYFDEYDFEDFYCEDDEDCEEWEDYEDYEMTKEDCMPGEQFDARYEMCFLACDTLEECEAIEDTWPEEELEELEPTED